MPNTRVLLLAAAPEPVRSDRGLTITPDTTFDHAPPLDVLCVPGGPGVNALMGDESFLAWLREQAQQARYVTAVCTGALLLGAAGLLRGYRATTHWLSLDLLPLFGAQPAEERVVIDRNRITGGGVTAGIDFGLVVAAQLHDEATAREIQLTLEYDPAPPFTSGSPRTADPALVAQARHAAQRMQHERRELAERAAARLEHICLKETL
jgi:cyclohexyl-isocyanide hydratase